MKKRILTFGELMLRLSPPNYQIIEDAHHYEATFGGTEANVAISLAQFGHDTAFVTKLPQNQLGEAAIKYLKANHVDTSLIQKEGSNIGIYFLETGFGLRSSKVLYNRKNSSFTTISSDDISIESMLNDVGWFHFSGISLALHDNVHTFIKKVLAEAKKRNIIVSFDCNYRSSLWTIEAARTAYQSIKDDIDIFFMNTYDAKHFFEIDCQEEDALFHLQKVFDKTQARYIFGYQRDVLSANENKLRGYLITKEKIVTTQPIRFNIFDRIGSGDAFAAGIIHGLIKNEMKDLSFALEFGLAASALKHTLWGDAFKLDEKDVLQVMEKHSIEIKR